MFDYKTSMIHNIIHASYKRRLVASLFMAGVLMCSASAQISRTINVPLLGPFNENENFNSSAQDFKGLRLGQSPEEIRAMLISIYGPSAKIKNVTNEYSLENNERSISVSIKYISNMFFEGQFSSGEKNSGQIIFASPASGNKSAVIKIRVSPPQNTYWSKLKVISDIQAKYGMSGFLSPGGRLLEYKTGTCEISDRDDSKYMYNFVRPGERTHFRTLRNQCDIGIRFYLFGPENSDVNGGYDLLLLSLSRFKYDYSLLDGYLYQAIQNLKNNKPAESGSKP